MNRIYQTKEFTEWLKHIADALTRNRIVRRIRQAAWGNFGDHASVGEGVWEMRLHFGPGYRVYYFQSGNTVYYLLVGGDKSSQSKDIERAIRMKKEMERRDQDDRGD